ncbi:MAG: porin [Thermodesulfobacteriota bacterium]
MKLQKLLVLVGIMLLPSLAFSVEVYKNGDVSLDAGFWAQAWYQYVDDYDRDGDGKWDDKINDFMMRRAYFNLNGTVTPKISFFLHYAGDRIGQEGLDNAGQGLGSGLATRDAWVTYKLIKDDVMVQVGRMYVPFTRDYGTTSTKALLTTELNWGQGGLRSGIFYPSKVGRDDGVTLWGNVLEDKLQYRLMVGEGEESSSTNADDNLRFAGRLSLNLFDPETAWFNSGTYLGKKKIMAVGAGFDHQRDLMLAGTEKNYEAYTVDAHLDLPLDSCAVTCELAYLWIENIVNTVTWSALTTGRDGDMVAAKAGVLLKEKIQPFAHYEVVMPEPSGADDTVVYGLGCNYYLKGPANKLTLEWSKADDDTHTVDIITCQFAFGL